MALIGGAWLAKEYGIEPVQPLRYQSKIGASRLRHFESGIWRNQFPPQYQPPNTIAGHLEFMFRHEAVHLEFFYRLFRTIDSNELAGWIRSAPTGKYARRAGFFYEHLTGLELDFEGVSNGGYVDALEPDRYFTSSIATNDQRWRVRHNLPGTSWATPTVLLTDEVKEAMRYDIRAQWQELEREFGADLLLKSAVWLTTKESRASFAIEHEQDDTDRTQRFARAIAEFTGRYENPFDIQALENLQRAILGENATRYGLRRSPIFVGEQRLAGQTVHYIGPHYNELERLLNELRTLDLRTRHANSIVRAAILSFLFVYIHPLSDGNGRVSRYLINDVFRRDGEIADPFIIPVSSVINSAMPDYDRVLEQFSKPFMAHYQGQYRFGQEVTYEDGVISNFAFDAYDDALIPLRYPDLTNHVAYLARVVRQGIETEMVEEARYLLGHTNARKALNEVIEGSSHDLDRMIRSIRQNQGAVSGKLRAEFPILENEGIASRASQAVMQAFEASPTVLKT
ncbi:MAG: cell filamentation protein Fic [Armatimonadetes bacterium]|nr:cell filamentation protein Fic [Armatimonadota bacterium]